MKTDPAERPAPAPPKGEAVVRPETDSEAFAAAVEAAKRALLEPLRTRIRGLVSAVQKAEATRSDWTGVLPTGDALKIARAQIFDAQTPSDFRLAVSKFSAVRELCGDGDLRGEAGRAIRARCREVCQPVHAEALAVAALIETAAEAALADAIAEETRFFGRPANVGRTPHSQRFEAVLRALGEAVSTMQDADVSGDSYGPRFHELTRFLNL